MATKTPTRTRDSARPVRFEYHAPEAKRVLVAGDFTGWEQEAKRMVRSRASGAFVADVRLAPGTYQYKFIVDGEWREDPKAQNVPNDRGTRNSICDVG